MSSTSEQGSRAAVADHLPDPVVIIDEYGQVCWANAAAERLMGPLEGWIGTSGLSLVHADDSQLAACALTSVQDKAVGTPIELRIATREGWTLAEVVGAGLPDGHVLLTMRDLTARRRWEVAGDETACFRSLVHHAAAITMLLAADGTLGSVSGSVTRQLGVDPEDVCGRPLSTIVHPDDHDALTLALAGAPAATSTDPVVVEVRLLDRTGRAVPFELSLVSLLDDPTVEGIVVSAHDITRLRAAQEALEQLAAYDGLTGAANRRTFDAALEHEWLLTSRDGVDSYVVVADLNHFKELNDAHGHAAGDEALRQFSIVLRGLVRSTDVVARLGGDEFGVILVRCGGEAAAIGLEDQLHEELLSRSARTGVPLSAAVGHSSLRKAPSPEAALHRADLAMLATKRPRVRSL